MAGDNNVEEIGRFPDMGVVVEDAVALAHTSVSAESVAVDVEGNYFAVLFDCCYSYYKQAHIQYYISSMTCMTATTIVKSLSTFSCVFAWEVNLEKPRCIT